MTAQEFRRLVLSLPEVTESAHMGHPDFRVENRIFATLGFPGRGWAMIKLAPEEQEWLVRADPETFTPVPGGWGRAGGTNVRLRSAGKGQVREALRSAWRRQAPKSLAARQRGE